MKLSVLMSVYNGEKYLKEAIESILAQTFPEFEFLIMDDGSKDASRETLESYKVMDERIKLFTQENAGLAESLNRLIEFSKGEYLARMDADDISQPRRFEEQVTYLDQHPNSGLVATACYEIAPNGLVFTKKLLPDDEGEIKRKLLKGENPIAHGSVMMRKSVLDKLDQLPYRTRIVQDYDLWRRLCEITTIGVVNIPLYKLRRTSGAISIKTIEINHKVVSYINKSIMSGESDSGKINEEIKKHLKKREGGGDANKAIAMDAYLNAKGLFRNQHYLPAITLFIQSLACSITRKKALMFICLCMLGNYGHRIHSIINPNAVTRSELEN